MRGLLEGKKRRLQEGKTPGKGGPDIQTTPMNRKHVCRSSHSPTLITTDVLLVINPF
jgi:hypothetical protein